jgi:hypothetical protein
MAGRSSTAAGAVNPGTAVNWIILGVHPGHQPAQTRTGQELAQGARAKERLLGCRSGHSVAGD